MKVTATFALASVLASSADASTFKVRVRNLTYLQPFSPPLIVAHTNDVALFKEAFPASEAIQIMAENGDNSALLEFIASPDVAPYICGVVAGDAPVLPGDTFRGDLVVDDKVCPDPVYSLVGMLINTNDMFVGIDAADLVTSTIKEFPPAFDAGTEANNEDCDFIPGPACDMESGNLPDPDNAEGFIHIGRGFHGVGPVLTEARYDWRNPVAEVFITFQG